MSNLLLVGGAAPAQPDNLAMGDEATITVTIGLPLYDKPGALGKQLRNSHVADPARTLVAVLAGQSNGAAVAPAAYAPAAGAAVQNFNPYDGGVYAYSDPPLGCSGPGGVVGGGPGCIGGYIADRLIQRGLFDRVIIVPVCVGGTSIDVWANGVLANRLPQTMRRLAAAGLLSLPNVIVMQMQGEADTSTTQANYAARQATLIANARAAGFTGRYYIAQQTYAAGTTGAGARAAQAAAVDNPNGIYAGPDVDVLGDEWRLPDRVHFTNAGLDRAAELWQFALEASGAPFA